MAAEERLTREVAKTRKAQAETKQLREQIIMLEAQLATKQETMQDLMDESQALEVRGCSHQTAGWADFVAGRP